MVPTQLYVVTFAIQLEYRWKFPTIFQVYSNCIPEATTFNYKSETKLQLCIKGGTLYLHFETIGAPEGDAKGWNKIGRRLLWACLGRCW